MLAKQGWRLIKNPNSLAAQVLSAKYFPEGDFLKAKIGKNSSHLEAKPLLEEGLLWRIGNGQSTKIWHEKWLPTPTSFKIQSRINKLDAEAKVEELIDQDTKARKMHLIKEILSQEEASTIQKIPLSVCNNQDKLTWRCTTNGLFSVRSAHHLKNEMQ